MNYRYVALKDLCADRPKSGGVYFGLALAESKSAVH